jgi:RNA polymerase sigma-70 factor (ECF subfamily)
LHVPADDAVLTGTDTEAQLEARDMLERLETAMLRLRPLTREIFMAHRLDGYTYREIAERTGLSLKRVEKHMSRAIAQLDDVLGMDTR